MAKVLQRNPDGSIVMQEDDVIQTRRFDPATGQSIVLPEPITIPGRKLIVRQDLTTGDFSSEPYVEAAPAAAVDAAPNLADYAIPQAPAAPEAPSAPRMAMRTQQQITQTGTAEQRADIMAQADLGGQQQLAGAEAAAQVGIERATAEATTIATGLEEQEKLMRMQQQKERIREERINRAGQQLQETFDNLEKQEIDPNRFYARMDTGAQVAAGLAIGLGAVGQALMGLADNPAMATINRAIDRDIEAQKMDLEKARGSAQVASSIYSQMRDQFADERTATEATRAAMLKLVDVRLQKIASSTKSKELAAQSVAMSGKINEDIAKTKGAILKEVGDKIAIEQTAAPVDTQKIKNDIRQAIKDSPQLKEYAEAREGLREFDIALKSNALGAGVISFIAKGLKQGSFGEAMLNILDWATIPERVEDEIRRSLGGSVNSKLAKKLYTFLQAKEASQRADLGAMFEELDKSAKEAGTPGLQSFFATGPIGSNSKLGELTKGRKKVGEAP
jgi:hypothetical protein